MDLMECVCDGKSSKINYQTCHTLISMFLFIGSWPISWLRDYVRLYNKFIDSEIYEIINVIIITIIRNDWWWWWWWVATVVVVAVVLRFDQIVAIHLPSNHGLTWICLFGLRFSINSCRNEKPRICIYLDIHKI